MLLFTERLLHPKFPSFVLLYFGFTFFLVSAHCLESWVFPSQFSCTKNERSQFSAQGISRSLSTLCPHMNISGQICLSNPGSFQIPSKFLRTRGLLYHAHAQEVCQLLALSTILSVRESIHLATPRNIYVLRGPQLYTT